MGADDAVGFDVDNLSLLFPEETAQEVVVVYLSQKADSLRVLASCRRQFGFQGNFPHFLLHQVTDGEEQTLHLDARELCEEVRLVFHWVFCCAEPRFSVAFHDGGIVTRSYLVIAVADEFLKGSELDEAVAHHIGIGCQSCFHSLDGISHHAFPILLLQVDHLQGQTVFVSCSPAHFKVFLRRASRVLFALHSYFNIIEVRTIPLFVEQVQGHGGIHAARKEQCYLHPSMMSVITSLMSSPAAFTCCGMKLVAVMPGVVFISSRLMVLSTMM